MKANPRQLLISGGIVIGAAACGCLVWWIATPLPSESTVAEDSPPALPIVEAKAESALPVPALSAPPPLPELDAILHQATATAGIERTETTARADAIIEEARRRVAQDPKAALAWALLQGELARPALEVVLDDWSQADPAAAFEAARWIADGNDRNLRDYALLRVVESWAGNEPVAALKAVGTLPSWPAAALLQGRVLIPWAEKDPVAAAAGLKTLLSGDRAGKDLGFLQSTVANVAQRLAVQDTARAAEWALGFPEGSAERTGAVSGVVAGWYGTDAKGVTEWLNRMEEGAALDAGSAALAGLSTQVAPGISLQWAQTISNEARRSAMTVQVAARWLATEPEKAEAWIRDSKDLSEKQRETILTTGRALSEMNALLDRR